MKEYINYYYNLDIEKITFCNKVYFLESKQRKYAFLQCLKKDIEKYYDRLKKYLNKDYLEIIKNRNGNYLTIINGKYYTLLNITELQNHKTRIDDICVLKLPMVISPELDIINYSSWVKMWERKIDYIEKWFILKKNEYYEILDDFYYFIGLSENAVLYLKNALCGEKNDNDRLTIEHLRMRNDTDMLYYYNPANIILDHPGRDIGEYIKSKLLNSECDFTSIERYLRKMNFSKYGAMMIYARVLFPNIFFDYIEEKILENKKIDPTYVKSISLSTQKFLCKISKLLKKIYDINMVEWIVNDN